jgi:hypothetical protein
MLTLTSASGYFTLAAAGTYLLEQPGFIYQSDSNTWILRNDTTSTNLKTFDQKATTSLGADTFLPWFYTFTVSGTSNNFSLVNANTVNTSLTTAVYLRITKLS